MVLRGGAYLLRTCFLFALSRSLLPSRSFHWGVTFALMAFRLSRGASEPARVYVPP